jgi:hypothetical protein
MQSFQQPQHSTRMFARVLGPFLAITCITAVVRASEMRALVSQFGANQLWPWVTGAFILVGGLIIVALHPYWHGAAAVTVSVMGWLLALRGLLLLAFPKIFMSMANSMLDATALWHTICICVAAIGLYLAYVGWMPDTRRPEPRLGKSTPDVPSAA